MAKLLHHLNRVIAARYVMFGVRLADSCLEQTCAEPLSAVCGPTNSRLQLNFRRAAAQEEDGARGALIAMSAPALAAFAGACVQTIEPVALLATFTLCAGSGCGVVVYSLDQNLRTRLGNAYAANGHEGFLDHLLEVKRRFYPGYNNQ